MYVTEKRINSLEWVELSEANTGDTFVIQNISDDRVRYCVMNSQPDTTVHGNVLLPAQQLKFKKVGGSLYMKQDGSQDGYVVIERVEE